MTKEKVINEVKLIRASKGDPESAHGKEDELFEEVLRTIADGQISQLEMIELAHEALKSRDIEFPRWCA